MGASEKDLSAVTLSPEEVEREIENQDRQSQQYMENEPTYDRIAYARIPITVKNTQALVITLGAFAAFSGLLSGLDQSVISGALPGIRLQFIKLGDWKSMDDPKLSNDISLISSLMPLGAMAGALMMMPLNTYFGRRNSIIISCMWYTLGGGLCAGARSVGMLFAGRFILGIGVGIEGGCVGIYISECVPPELRGNLVSIYQMMIALGEVVGYAVGAIFFNVPGSWRWMLGSSVLFSTILWTGMCFLPESPRWLVSKAKHGRAWQVWKSLRNVSDPKNLEEYLAMEITVRNEIERSSNVAWYQRYLEVCVIPRNRRALIYASAMIFFGQMTGINAVMYNMSNLMAKMNFSDRESVLMSMVGGASLFLGTIPAVFTMDRFGRRSMGAEHPRFHHRPGPRRRGLSLHKQRRRLLPSKQVHRTRPFLLGSSSLHGLFRRLLVSNMGRARRKLRLQHSQPRHGHLLHVPVPLVVHRDLQLRPHASGHDLHGADDWFLRRSGHAGLLLPVVFHA